LLGQCPIFNVEILMLINLN